MDNLIYTGNALRTKHATLDLDIYDPSPALVEAVNLAILLRQPLLLMGEPGCGKTRLAEAVAAELHGDRYKDHYFRWDIKSTSKGREGIYQYDALKRLYDANAKNADARETKKYVTYGKLAEALTSKQNGKIPNILLIDEIDKADIDFPNDLLLEIEKGEFYVPELNKRVERKSDVLIFITSNRERELPPAFLRRCLYFYIHFPRQEDLIKIIRARFGRQESDPLVENAVNLFLDIRARLDGQFGANEKKPATSELLEWFKVIAHYHRTKNKAALPEHAQVVLSSIETYEKGKLDHMKIPFPQVLLKTWESNQLFEKTSM